MFGILHLLCCQNKQWGTDLSNKQSEACFLYRGKKKGRLLAIMYSSYIKPPSPSPNTQTTAHYCQCKRQTKSRGDSKLALRCPTCHAVGEWLCWKRYLVRLGCKSEIQLKDCLGVETWYKEVCLRCRLSTPVTSAHCLRFRALNDFDIGKRQRLGG